MQCSSFPPEGVTETSGYRFEYYLHLIKSSSHLNRESIYTAQTSTVKATNINTDWLMIFSKQTECRTKWEMTFHCAWLKILDARVFTDHDMIFYKWKTATMLDFNKIAASKAILANVLNQEGKFLFQLPSPWLNHHDGKLLHHSQSSLKIRSSEISSVWISESFPLPSR